MHFGAGGRPHFILAEPISSRRIRKISGGLEILQRCWKHGLPKGGTRFNGVFWIHCSHRCIYSVVNHFQYFADAPGEQRGYSKSTTPTMDHLNPNPNYGILVMELCRADDGFKECSANHSLAMQVIRNLNGCFMSRADYLQVIYG